MTTFSAVMDVTEENSISDKQSVSIFMQLLLERGSSNDDFCLPSSVASERQA